MLVQARRVRSFAPLRARLWSARWLGVVLSVVGGLGISLALFKSARDAERRELADALSEQADQRVELLQTQFTRSMEVLHSIAALFRSHHSVTATEFESFVSGALKRQPELQALGWSPLSRSGTGRESVRVQFIEPAGRNAAALGFDLWSSEPRRTTLSTARDQGLPAATPPLHLVQETGRAIGFIVFLPVYSDAAPGDITARRKSLVGYTSAVFRVPDLLEPVEQSFRRQSLGMTLRDLSTDITLAGTGISGLQSQVHRTLDVAGREWELTVQPGPAFLAQHPTNKAWRTLAVGACLSLLLGGYLYAILSRTRLVEREVRKRTAQLSTQVIERARAEEAARRAEARYRGIFDNSVEGIFQTTPDGHYLSANRALANLYAYESPDQLIRDLSNIAHQLYVEPGRRDEFARQVRQNGVVTDFESQIFRKDGQIIWISENARAVSDPAGEILYYEGFVVDVSHRKQAEAIQLRTREELEELVSERTEALAAANAAKSRFLASMSHEIRTPMNAILGYAQILHRDQTLLPAQRNAVATIFSSGNHLLGLIDGILDLSRIEAGHIEVDSAEFDMTAVAGDLERMFTHHCDEKQIALRVRTVTGMVIGDERKLRQVLINLIGNAVRFTDHGEVSLEIHRPADGYLQFIVRDTGVGIAPEAIARIFEPFQQAHRGIVRGGSGLGLTIAQQHVRLMGGELSAQSIVGSGSSFSFTLPIPAACSPIDRHGEPAWETARLKAGELLRVLVVDDIVENRDVLAELLRSSGCEVSAADSGPAAIQMLRADPSAIDLVFIDILMPEMSGFETAAAIHELPGAETVRLIATSAAMLAHERGRSTESGFHDILPKPFSCKRLFQCIQNTMEIEFDFDMKPTGPEPWSFDLAAAEAAALPQKLRDSLREAAELCSITDARLCAEKIGTQSNSHLARCLRDALQNYDLSTIERLFIAATVTAGGI